MAAGATATFSYHPRSPPLRMTAAPDDAAPRPHWAVRMNRRNRSVFFALLAVVIGVHLFEHQAPASAWLALGLQFALYPQLVY